MFQGDKAETKTLVPVLTQFRERQGSAEVIVVADAGMLSAANSLALEDAGFRFTTWPPPWRRPVGVR